MNNTNRTPQWKLNLRRVGREIGEFFQFDIWEPIKSAFNKARWFFHNIKVFWKTLWEFRDFDYEYVVNLFIVGLIQLQKRIEAGFEEDKSKHKKVAKIGELIFELQRDIDSEVDDMVESGQIKMEEWSAAYDRAKTERFEKIFSLIRGQHDILFDARYLLAQKHWKEEHGREPNSNELYDIWVELFDGSGIDGWWE